MAHGGNGPSSAPDDQPELTDPVDAAVQFSETGYVPPDAVLRMQTTRSTGRPARADLASDPKVESGTGTESDGVPRNPGEAAGTSGEPTIVEPLGEAESTPAEQPSTAPPVDTSVKTSLASRSRTLLTRGRISRPMVVAAALAGAVLITLPFVFSSIGTQDTHSVGAQGNVRTELSNGGSGTSGSSSVATPTTQTPTTSTSESIALPPSQPNAPSPTQAMAPGTDSGRTGAASKPTTNGVAGPPAQVVRTVPTYSAVAGPWCTNPTTGWDRVGYYQNGKSGWETHSGGYAAEGCNQNFQSMPMSGNANTDDDSNYMHWTFNTAPVSTGSCRLSVYIPNLNNIQYVGGNPAYYTVHNATVMNDSTQIGSVRINQVDQLGQWVNAGTYRITTGVIVIKLHSRGQDWNASGPTYAHLAGAQIRAVCTG